MMSTSIPVNRDSSFYPTTGRDINSCFRGGGSAGAGLHELALTLLSRNIGSEALR